MRRLTAGQKAILKRYVISTGNAPFVYDDLPPCDWCGRTFKPKTPYVEYTDGSCYHHRCLKSVGGKTDLGRDNNLAVRLFNKL